MVISDVRFADGTIAQRQCAPESDHQEGALAPGVSKLRLGANPASQDFQIKVDWHAAELTC